MSHAAHRKHCLCQNSLPASIFSAAYTVLSHLWHLSCLGGWKQLYFRFNKNIEISRDKLVLYKTCFGDLTGVYTQKEPGWSCSILCPGAGGLECIASGLSSQARPSLCCGPFMHGGLKDWPFCALKPSHPHQECHTPHRLPALWVPRPCTGWPKGCCHPLQGWIQDFYQGQTQMDS